VVRVKLFGWNSEKDSRLRDERGVGFQDVLLETSEGRVLDVIDSTINEKCQPQRAFVRKIDGSAHYVPSVETDEEIYLKTIIPSRKLNKKYQEAEILKDKYSNEELELLKRIERGEWSSVAGVFEAPTKHC
jgi:hypothetical protein